MGSELEIQYELRASSLQQAVQSSMAAPLDGGHSDLQTRLQITPTRMIQGARHEGISIVGCYPLLLSVIHHHKPSWSIINHH